MSSEERVGTVRGEVSINISSLENFLRNWIDNNKLATILSLHSVLGRSTETFAKLVTTLPEGLPAIQPLRYVFHNRGETLRKKKVNVLCEYTDLLLDYVIYIFKYYGYDFVMEGSEIDKEDEDNIFLAKRLTKIYQIISKYIIGNPDLSVKDIRRNDPKQHKSKHREIFKLAEDISMLKAISRAVPQSVYETLGISRGQSQETNYTISPVHPSLLEDTPPPSPTTRGGTRKIRRYNNHRKTSRRT